MNPTWAIVIVNTIALFAVPFFTYRYAHRNNLKILKEKWLSNVRDAASILVEACDKLYYANDTRYQSTSSGNILSDSERKSLLKRSEEAQAEVTGASAKLRLLFKEDSDSFKPINSAIDKLISSVDRPKAEGSLFYVDSSQWKSAQNDFLKSVNTLLQAEWKSLSK